jgi:mannose-1-phosphate guanylyltransferase/mannose-6-phosphate isomerase
MFSHIIILAGGIGERLFPVSTNEFPKQFIEAADGTSFFQMSLERALALRPSGTIFVITRKRFVGLVAEQCAGFINRLDTGDKQFLENSLVIIGEPAAKHTAVAVQCACTYLNTMQQDSGGQSLLVLTSDHIINPMEAFLENCRTACREAESGSFVLFAVKPDFPSTEFGYIQTGIPEPSDKNVCKILSFHEKPDAETARKYLAGKNYYWNSGMFAFTVSTFLQEIKKYAPAVYNSFTCAAKPELTKNKAITAVDQWGGIEEIYQSCPAVSLDKGIAEKTSRASCVVAGFSWNDAGTWDSFAGLVPEPGKNTVKINSDDCYVYSDIPVALCGVSGLIIAIKNGKAVIMKKGESALIKDAAAGLNTNS